MMAWTSWPRSISRRASSPALQGGFGLGCFRGLPDGVVFHQAPAHFFGSDDRRLLGGGGQHGTGTPLQLPRPLGRDDDEAIGALFRIVRDGAVRVIPGSFVGHNLTSFFN